MRRLLLLSSLAILLGSANLSARAADADNAREVLEKAIRAHGGADKLTRLRAMVRTAKGEISFGGGAGAPATCEIVIALPDRCRWTFELEANGQKLPLTVAINGDKGWRAGGGKVVELSKLEAEETRPEVYVASLLTLLPLKEAGFELSTVPEIKVGDSPAAGINVSRKSWPDVKLYFDKKTGLLVKAERKGKEAGLDTTKEYLFSTFKEFDGLRLPTHHLERSNGKKVAEWTITGYKFPGRIEEKEFAKP